MVDAGGCQMTDPPDPDKESQQEPMETFFVRDQAGFQVRAATFGILKRRFHAHPPGILTLASFTR
jgi:hypothetical protein